MKYLILFLCLFSFVANAQEYKPAPPKEPFGTHHMDFHSKDYSKWMRPDTHTSCCNNTDCDSVISWKDDNQVNHFWYLESDGTLHDVKVPKSKIIKDKVSPDGKSHACATVGDGPDGIFIYCFLEGDQMF
jgi:hypothetical protein